MDGGKCRYLFAFWWCRCVAGNGFWRKSCNCNTYIWGSSQVWYAAHASLELSHSPLQKLSRKASDRILTLGSESLGSNCLECSLFQLLTLTGIRGLSQTFQELFHKTIIWNANHKIKVSSLEAVLPEPNARLRVSLHRLHAFLEGFFWNLPQICRRGVKSDQNMITYLL